MCTTSLESTAIEVYLPTEEVSTETVAQAPPALVAYFRSVLESSK